MKGDNGEHPFGDSGQLILLVLFLLIWGVDSFILQISTFLSDHISLTIRLVILGLLLATAVYLVRAGHVVVKHEQRPSGIVSTGAFGYVRHPLYLGSILFYIGLAVATASLVSLGLVVVICLFYNYIASYEETLLEQRCDETYRRYKNKTGKWLPKMRQNRCKKIN
jgi:protein-S-isoprenylcysteine O-methyltransferase Ste14